MPSLPRPRRGSRRGRVAWIAAVAVLCAATVEAAPRMTWRVPSLSGGWISHEDFKGRIVILDIWATWCGPCRMVIPHLVALQREFGADGVAVVGINADDPGVARSGAPARSVVRDFAREYGIDYPIGLMNAEAYREVRRVMGFSEREGMSIPTTILIGRNGRVLRRYPGYFPGQEDEIRELLRRILAEERAAAGGAP